MSSPPTSSGSTILDFSPPSNNIFQDISHIRSQTDAFTGFIAGYNVGSELPDQPRVRLSASSVEDVEPYNVNCLDVTEEASDEDDEMEMRISEGSVYPSAFSFISMNEIPPQLENSTLSEIHSDTSTLDYTGNSAELYNPPTEQPDTIFSDQIELELFNEPEANSTVMSAAEEENFFPEDKIFFEDKIELKNRFKAEDNNEIMFFQPSLSSIEPDDKSPPDFFTATEEELDNISNRTYDIINDLKISEQVVEDLDELNEEFARRISTSSHASSRKDTITDGIERSDSFGDFADEPLKSRSSSSVESFGSFDDGPELGDPEVWREEEVTSPLTTFSNACEACFPDTLSLRTHSPPSPKNVLRSNFVWVKTRAQVTKPSYRWDQLKLSSYLLGALGVRKPITLNRLRNTPVPGSTPSISRASSVRDMSPAPSGSPPLSPEPQTYSLQEDRSDMSSNGSWDEPPGKLGIPQCCKPLPSVIKMKFNQHRRVNSVPIFKSPSPSRISSPISKEPDTRSLTSSPRVQRKDGMSSSSSQDSSFDQSHAARGLQLLQQEDIEAMRSEMQSRVAELSGTLIKEFQYRGDADHSREVKTAFVAALRAAEEKKSKGQLSSKQMDWLPLHSKENSNVCPTTEVLVLLTQVLLALAGNTPHQADLIKHYKSLQ